MNKKTILLAIVLIILLGTFLRIYDLGKESMNSDETNTMLTLNQPDLKSSIESITLNEDLPSIDFLFMKSWSNLVGKNTAALRFFPAFFSIISILLLFLITKKFFTRKTALISSLLLATSMVSISNAQTIRTYTFFTFTTLLSFYFFFKLKELFKKENKTQKKYYVYYIISAILSCYTSYFAIFPLMVQNIIVLMNTKKLKSFSRRWLISQGTIFLFCIPLIFLLIIQLSNVHGLFQYVLFNKLGIPQILANIGIYYFIIPIIILPMVGLIIHLKKDSALKYYKKFKLKQKQFLIFLALLLITYIILIPNLLEASYLTRYTLFLLPFAFIYISNKITKLKPKKLQAIVLIIILLINSFALFIYYSETSKTEWNKSAEFVSLTAKEGDIILFQGYSQRPFNYYFKKQNQQIVLERYEETNDEFFNSIKPKLQASTGIWLIDPNNYDPNKNFYIDSLNKEYKNILKKEYKGITIYYFKK